MIKKIKIVALFLYGYHKAKVRSVSAEKKQADEIIEAGMLKLYSS
jgi:hypothetical protein